MKIIIIGGGAAGLLAAASAALNTANEVVIIEKGAACGRKLNITGKGRCNITNDAEKEDFIKAFHPNGRFLYSAFSRFFSYEIKTLLADMGVETKTERGGRVFPISDKASDVTQALLRYAKKCGAKIKTNVTAKSIDVKNGRVCGVNIYGGYMDCDCVIIATGGMSYPKTGSTGDGYRMAGELGHTINALSPALSALFTKEKWVASLSGLSLKNAAVTAYAGEKKIASDFGEMLFTHTGISGPVILTLSRSVRKHDNATLSIDLKPALSKEMLHARLIRDFKHSRVLKSYFKELLPKSLAELFPVLSNVDGDRRTSSVTVSERNAIVDTLKDLRLTIKGLAPIEEAIVTAGGVKISEINPATMESKLVNGLFFAGEVIDIDAETGGYNLQAAFSTGYAAGMGAAEYVNRL